MHAVLVAKTIKADFIMKSAFICYKQIAALNKSAVSKTNANYAASN